MRIAVSGSHCTGKSTLIDEFLRAHPEFAHEPEAYTVLTEEFGEDFSAEPCVEDFRRQLEFNVQRLKEYRRGTRVIFERCPIDFLAYIECVSEIHPLPRGGTDPILVDSVVEEVIQNLALIVYLPTDPTSEPPDDEFPKLRKAVDRRLSAIYREDELGIIASSNLIVIEARGPIEKRLRILESALI
jgi:predicted ATPase